MRLVDTLADEMVIERFGEGRGDGGSWGRGLGFRL